MARFMGSHQNRLDKKGRVSVPAPFRAELTRLGTSEIVLRPSHNQICIEVWSMPAFEAMAAGLERLDTFSEEQQVMSATLYSASSILTPDAEGRVMLPPELIEFARLGETVSFVGMGKTFEIWEPEAAKQRTNLAFNTARAKGMTLPPARPVAGAAA